MTRDTLQAMLDRERATRRRETQVVIRLSGEEREQLESAARAQSMPAATLARILIMAGLEDLATERPGKEG